jgi:hypothetical protein
MEEADSEAEERIAEQAMKPSQGAKPNRQGSLRQVQVM